MTSRLIVFLYLLTHGAVLAFVTSPSVAFQNKVQLKSTLLNNDASSSLMDFSSSAIDINHMDLDGSSMLLATEAWVQPLQLVLDPSLNLLSFMMLCRVVISWYPETNVNELPYNLVVWPTEPLLKITRGVVPPAFGVDISPIVWLGLFTFLHEIFLGQQGLLTLKIKYGI